jgi:uncharacterized membrane protein
MPWLLIAYPLLSHIAAYTHNQSLAAAALAVFVAMPLQAALRRGRVPAWLLLAACIVALVALARSGRAIVLMYLPPVVIPASVLAVFANSLRTGHTPVVSQIATQIRGEPLPPDLQQYCRRVTQCWVLLLSFIASSSLLLAFFASLELWSTLTNVLLYLLIGAAFVVEYGYRRWRFGHLRHESFVRFVSGLFTTRVR